MTRRHIFRWREYSRVLQLREISVTLFARFYAFKRRLIKWSDRLQASTGRPSWSDDITSLRPEKALYTSFSSRPFYPSHCSFAQRDVLRDDIYCSTIIIETIACCVCRTQIYRRRAPTNVSWNIFILQCVATNAIALPHLWRRICLPANVISVNTIELARCSY